MTNVTTHHYTTNTYWKSNWRPMVGSLVIALYSHAFMQSKSSFGDRFVLKTPTNSNPNKLLMSQISKA